MEEKPSRHRLDLVIEVSTVDNGTNRKYVPPDRVRS